MEKSLPLKILKYLVLLLIYLYPNPLFAEWVKWQDTYDGIVYYNKNVKKHDNKIYYLRMKDYFKPTITGVLCSKTYIVRDCLNKNFKYLSMKNYSEPMCTGSLTIPNHVMQEQINKIFSDWHQRTIDYEYSLERTLCKKF